MHKLVMILILILVVAPASAMEVPFRDGSVVDAVSYTVTGSYVMLEMENGGKVAYDVADIDLEALRQAEAAAGGSPADAPEAPSARCPRRRQLHSSSSATIQST